MGFAPAPSYTCTVLQSWSVTPVLTLPLSVPLTPFLNSLLLSRLHVCACEFMPVYTHVHVCAVCDTVNLTSITYTNTGGGLFTGTRQPTSNYTTEENVFLSIPQATIMFINPQGGGGFHLPRDTNKTPRRVSCLS